MRHHMIIFDVSLHESRRSIFNLNVQDVQFHSDPVVVFCVHLNAVDMTEIGQKGHEVCLGVDYMAYTVFGPHQQRHLRVLLALLQKGRQSQHMHIPRHFLYSCM